MTGAIAEAYYGKIPKHIYDFCLAKIPLKQKELISAFYDNINKK